MMNYFVLLIILNENSIFVLSENKNKLLLFILIKCKTLNCKHGQKNVIV